jgi:hypothetical protein
VIQRVAPGQGPGCASEAGIGVRGQRFVEERPECRASPLGPRSSRPGTRASAALPHSGHAPRAPAHAPRPRSHTRARRRFAGESMRT